MACGYLQIKEKSSIVGYSKLNFKMLDLDNTHYNDRTNSKNCFPIKRQ